MKKVLISMGFIALALGATAQVKIKDGSVTSSTTPNANSILDLESTNKGLHVPRVSLTATNNPAPLNETVFSTLDSGLVVYNFATAGAAPYNVTPGLYYCDGTQWVRAAGKPDWLIFGNANSAVNGTPAGSTDSQYVMGRVAIGTNAAPRLYTATAGGDSAHKFAYLTVNGDVSINGITLGRGGGQGSTNTAVGAFAFANNTTGSYNTGLGNGAGSSLTTSRYNTAVGASALSRSNLGDYNTAVGANTLLVGGLGSYNTVVGANTLSNLFAVSSSGNTIIGANSIHVDAGGITIGPSNVIVGDSNFLVGAGNITIGGGNAIVGRIGLTTAAGKINVGYSNVILGDSLTGDVGTAFSGNANIVIGPYQTPAIAGGSNTLNIGGVIYGSGVDSTTRNAGKIGINVNQPNSSLQVGGSVSTPFVIKTAAYTLTATDFTVRFTGGAATLPAGTGISGRMYCIVNATGAAMTVSALSGTVTLLSGTQLATATSALFQTDGTNWYQVK